MRKLFSCLFILIGLLAMTSAGGTISPEYGSSGQAAFSFGMAALFGVSVRMAKGFGRGK